MSKSKVSVNSEELAVLNDSFPVVADNSNRLTLPRFGMLSKDIVEETGKGKEKKIKVIEASGTFFTEEGSGDKVVKDFLEGEEQDVIIVFHRKQIKYFDKGLEKFISSPVFDTDDQIIPLYLDSRVVAKGTKAELQARYPALTQKGKKTSDLKEYRVLYVLVDGVFYQMSLSISSGWAFSDYARTFKDGTSPATVVTTLGSVEETNGSNTYRKMTFTNKRPIDADELDLVKENQGIIKEAAQSSADYYLAQSTKAIEGESDADKKFAKDF